MSDSQNSDILNSGSLTKEATKQEVAADLNLETAKIPWLELQRFFAGGKLLLLQPDQDMLDVASSLVANDTERLQALIDKELIVHPSDDQAKQWIAEEAVLWAVVLNPWVLVQENID